jgi:hypothetical protein
MDVLRCTPAGPFNIFECVRACMHAGAPRARTTPLYDSYVLHCVNVRERDCITRPEHIIDRSQLPRPRAGYVRAPGRQAGTARDGTDIHRSVATASGGQASARSTRRARYACRPAVAVPCMHDVGSRFLSEPASALGVRLCTRRLVPAIFKLQLLAACLMLSDTLRICFFSYEENISLSHRFWPFSYEKT